MDTNSPAPPAKRRRPRRPPAYADQPFAPVWDRPVRIVHWLIVILLAALVVTGLKKGDWLAWHMRAGQVLLTLVIFRVIWGFVGSQHARFRAFLRGPRAVTRYARSLARPPHEPHATHNPLGGWMVMLLIAGLLVQAGSGLFANDDVLWDGPLVKWVTKETSDAITSVHRRFWWVLLGFAAAHITAAVSYLVVFRENLIHAMVTGRKRLPPEVVMPRGAQGSMAKALAIVAAVGLVLGYVLYRL
jgi:cytochrome b